MNIPIYAQEIVKQIRENPLLPVIELENEINRNDFVEISAWILKNYSRTTSHKFLLKFNARLQI